MGKLLQEIVRTGGADQVAALEKLIAKAEQILGVAGVSQESLRPARHLLTEWVGWLKEVQRASDSTIEVYFRECNRLLTVNDWGLKPPGLITANHIARLVNMNDDRHAATREKQLACLSAWFKWMVAKGAIKSNICGLVRVDRRQLSQEQLERQKRQPFKPGQLIMLIDACKQHHDAKWWVFAVYTSLDTGLRLGDICRLRWSSFISEHRFLAVYTGKTGRRVLLPVSDRMRAAFPEKVDSEDRLFPFKNNPNAESREFKHVMRSAGIVDNSLCFHCLRHNFCAKNLENGVPLDEVAYSMGHASPLTSQNYAH